ncbi:SusD/RagB family nutrient-binding outer membrane lipoprotein, partial [Flavobacteriaceae bacterium]|nr:SusD/RagB family nutrient-binding outer membrane lipoprotein [Flavobacteriaceae bacterium]
TTDLDIVNDPNQVTVVNGDLERYMTAIQVDFKSFANAMGGNGAALVRIGQMGSVNYVNAFSPASTNFEWRLAYSNMFSDMKNAEELATSLGARNKHIGVMKVLKAYTLMALVDYFGDVPFSEATNLADFPQPKLDDDAAVYAAAISMLDDAKTLLLDDESISIGVDYYYNNNFDKWVKLANTLKMNAYLNTRLVDGNAINKLNSIANSGNFIASTADDFQFRYDVVVNNQIDSRHPGYQSDYTAGGVTGYQSNWMMDQMLQDDDPRIRYYYYRQNECTPNSIGEDGEECPPNPEALFCSTQANPVHYLGSMVFCSVENGYWGRDHGFGGGIPPDTFLRTGRGVYPVGGNYDDSRFASVGLEQGGGGAGITPIWLASWSHFMLAEVALVSGGAASGYLQDAMQISIDKVMSFGSLDGDANLSTTDVEGGTVPTSGTVNSYIDAKVFEFINGNMADKWNILGLQSFVAHYGNGSNSYNFYRRTGYPKTLQFTVEPTPGNFVRSFFYPADEATPNSNVSQKPNVDGKVFWDNNPSSPGFPSSN